MFDAVGAGTMQGQPAEPPLLPGAPLVGSLLALREDPLAVFLRAAALEADVVRFKVATKSVYLVRRPEHVKYVLQENQKNFSKQTRGYAVLRLVLGNGLVTSEGEFWLRQRRLSQPTFHRQRIAGFGQTMVNLTQELLEAWAPRAGRGETVDVAEEMMTLTLRVVGHTLLSTEMGPSSPAVGQALHEVLHQVIGRATSPLQLPLWMPTPNNARLVRARRQLDGIVNGIISERRKSGGGEDLLAMLMAARDEDTGESMSDRQLRDEVMTLFLAGHETTANALTWALYLLSEHPEIRARLEQEVRDAVGERTPGVEDLPKLGYVLAVVQEAMRLYPPVWLLMRRCEADDVVGGYRIPKGAFVAVCAYTQHRDPRLFEAPERFDPERFVGAAAQKVNRFGYMPFSAGPRICIGNNFALMEGQLVLAAIVQRYRLDLLPGHPVKLDPAVTLRPRHGMKMRLAPRA